VPGPGCVGVPDDDVGDMEVPPPFGGWPGEEPWVVLGTVFPVTPPEVPLCGPPLLPPPPGSVDEDEEPPGVREELSRNPGCTKPSNSSAASKPAPATAACLVLIALPMPAGTVPPEASRLPR